MAKNVKLADIAKELKVSTVTVSKAISGKKGVGDALREQILLAADEMGYVRTTKLKEKRKSYNIGVIVAERYLQFSHSFYWQLYQKSSSIAMSYDSFLFLEEISPQMEEEFLEPKLLQEGKAEAVIVIGEFTKSYSNYLVENIVVPCVFIDTTIAYEKVDSIVGNNLMGGYKMTNYLFESGHTAIGFVGTRGCTSSIDDRFLGYLKSLMEHGIPINEAFIFDDRSKKDGGVESFESFMLPKDLPTAFFCNCDLTASLFIKKLEEEGYRVPQDISVVGFDHYPTKHIAGVEITTYECDIEGMAQRAVCTILMKLGDPDYKAGLVVITGNFIEKDSVKRGV